MPANGHASAPPPGIAGVIARAAAAHPDTPIILDAPLDIAPLLGTRLTYSVLAQCVDEVAGAFAAAGVGRGQRVAIVKRNNFDQLVCSYALMRLGAVPALIAAALDADTRRVLLDRLEPALVLTDCGSAGARWPTFSPSEASAHARLGALPAPAPARGDEPALIVHSSGTTGVPKLIVHSAANVERIAWVGRHQALVRLVPLRRTDLIAASLTWAHARAAIGYALAFAKAVPLLAISDPTPQSALPLVAEHEPTVVETHPNIFLQWERALASNPRCEPFRNVRLFVSTADAAHPGTVTALLGATRRCAPVYVEVYGMSEMGPATVSITRRRQRRRQSRVVGRSIPGFSRIRIVDPASGRRVRRGKVGAIEIATRAPLLSYVGEEERRAKQLHGRWFRTGDLGVKTTTGLVRLLDREADRVGSVMSCVHVEQRILARLPRAREVAIIKGPAGEAVPVVATVGDAPLDAGEWDLATRGLPPLAAPVHLPFGELPFTATWKVRRHLVHDRLSVASAAAG